MSDTREASRELDAEIAERVMDMNVFHPEQSSPGYLAVMTREIGAVALPAYSTSIAAAFSVVEAMRAKVYSFAITFHDGKSRSRTVHTTAIGERKPRDFTVSDEVHPAEPYWEATIMGASEKFYGAWSGLWSVKASTPALAICLAALAALDASTAKSAVERSSSHREG